MQILIGLDIGGTKMIAAAADVQGRILRQARAATPRDLAAGLAQLHALLASVRGNADIVGIGASAGGPLDWQTGIVSPLHQPEWREVPLKSLFEAEYHCPFSVDVDTNAAALAEYQYLVERGEALPSRLLYLTLSTGMGGGLVVDGALYRGGMGGAHPEAGHQAVPLQMRHGDASRIECECGAPDCLSALISGSGIQRVYGKPAAHLTAEEWNEVALHLGLGLRNLAVLYAPDRIVLGGGVAVGGGEPFITKAASIMRDRLKLVPPPEVRLSSLGYETALQGAIVLAMQAAGR